MKTRARSSAAVVRVRHQAFTLIELLTVIAIIGILAAILIPTVGKVRNTAQSARCVSNLRQIGQQIIAYATDSRGQLPNMQALTNSAALDPRVVSTDGKQLAYHLWPYYSKAPLSTQYTVGRVSIHEMLICPAQDTAVRAKFATGVPSGSGDQSSNSAQSYIINDVQTYGSGANRQTVFGYNGGGKSFNLATIEKKLDLSQAVNPTSTSLSRIWALQDADTLLQDQNGNSRGSQQTFIAGNKPSHGSSRNRLYLDGSVRKLTLEQSTKNNYN